MSDYYNLLKVAPEASTEEIRKAFRHLAKGAHPDALPNLPPKEREARQRRFILLAQAYETLRDPQRRRAYDRQRRKEAARRAGPAKTGSKTGRRREAPRSGDARPRPEGAGAAEAGDSRESLDDLLHEVEDLLGQFGLDLKQPFLELVDALLDWARDIFRRVMDAENGEEKHQTRPAAGEKEAAAGGDDSGRRPSPGKERPGRPEAASRRAEPARPGQSPRGAPPHGTMASTPSSRELEADLDALKTRVRKGEVASGRGASLEEELRQLKIRLGRK